jgi:hypothetical protein
VRAIAKKTIPQMPQSHYTLAGIPAYGRVRGLGLKALRSGATPSSRALKNQPMNPGLHYGYRRE